MHGDLRSDIKESEDQPLSSSCTSYFNFQSCTSYLNLINSCELKIHWSTFQGLTLCDAIFLIEAPATVSHAPYSERPCVTPCNTVWHFLALFDTVWRCVTQYDTVWHFVTLCDNVWHNNSVVGCTILNLDKHISLECFYILDQDNTITDYHSTLCWSSKSFLNVSPRALHGQDMLLNQVSVLLVSTVYIWGLSMMMPI